MRILREKISVAELKEIAKDKFGDMIKAVVDVDKELLAIDAELHADLEAVLLAKGSGQNSLWGLNFYPDIEGEDFLEFDSLINLCPSRNNMTRGVDARDIREKIRGIVGKWVEK